MKRWAVVLLVAWAGAAMASVPTKVRVIHEKDRTVYRKKTVVNFGDVTLDGEWANPEGAYVLDRERTHFKTLVKVKKRFTRKLRASTDDL